MPEFDDVVKRLRAIPVKAAALRAERRRISREVAAFDRAAVLRLAHRLIDAGIQRFVAYELVLYHKPCLESIATAEVEKLGQGMNGWGEIDCFGCYISGRAWRNGNIADKTIHAWARSDDWCWRRAALVSTVPLNLRAAGGTGDVKRTLAVCKMLAADRHDMVVKAMSWALRELAKHEPDAVRGFLADHGDGLAARVVREVNNKLRTGRKSGRSLTKNRFLTVAAPTGSPVDATKPSEPRPVRLLAI